MAGCFVIAIGMVLQRPLAQVPENTLKFAVGILLSAFGVFWTGEGLHFPWFGGDVVIFGLVVGFLTVAGLATRVARIARRDGPSMLNKAAS